MARSIFSQYKGGENRVTSTIIQVLKNLPVNVVEYFLDSFSGGGTGTFIHFKNQVKGKSSVPDAEISANFKLLFETKITPNSVNCNQLDNHLEAAKKENATLVYLTPDIGRPNQLEGEKYKDVIWKSFQDFHDLISELLDNKSLILSERDQFLFRNLQDFIEESDLLPPVDEVVIVAANSAWPAYQKYGLYICQANRSFRKVNYLGFYANGKIQQQVALIEGRFEELDLASIDPNASTPSVRKKLNLWLKDHPEESNKKAQVFDLSEFDSPKNKKLNQAITNDLKNNSGVGYAFTQGQRYVPLESLRSAKWTSDLINK